MLRTINKPALLTAILLFFSLSPYFLWGVISSFELFQPIISLLICFAFYINRNTTDKRNHALVLFLFFLLILYWVTTGISIGGFLVNCCCLFLPFAQDLFYKKTFTYFTNIYAFLVGISSIVWIFVLLGLLSPIGYIEPLNNIKTINYSVYPLLVQMNSISVGAFRFCGLFDEPGVVGTFSGIILFILGFHKKDWRCYALLLSGCLALSLFFYLIIIIYFLGRALLHRRFSMVIILSLVIGALYIYTNENELISDRIWSRVEWNSDEGTIAGNNRVVDEQAKAFYESRKGTVHYWIGERNFEPYKSMFEGSSSYKVIVLRAGMLFFILYLCFFFLFGYSYNKSYILGVLIYFALCFISIYQRPGMFSVQYFFLFPYYARYMKELQ